VVTKKVTGGGGCGSPSPAIANATVTIEDLGGVSSVSDATGAYSFASIPSDTYTVTASATGYAPVTKVMAVNGTAELDFVLTPTKGTEALASMVSDNAVGDAVVMAVAMLLVWLKGRRRAPNAEE
jgi:hypothetical protein